MNPITTKTWRLRLLSLVTLSLMLAIARVTLASDFTYKTIAPPGSGYTEVAAATFAGAQEFSGKFVAPESKDGQRFGPWSEPINLGPTINGPSFDVSPAISKNGLSLYFTSDRPGGMGGLDIWVSHRTSRKDPWGESVNLGPPVNTAFDESAPAFSSDGHSLFFISDREGGFGGGADIWVARRTHTGDDFDWEEPINAGPGVNSSYVDAAPGYFENEEEGAPLLYFGSTRPGGPGLFDIYVSAQAEDGSWGQAVLVPELSSPLVDQHPSVRFDGLELFLLRFSDSFDDSDLWVSTRRTTRDPWSEPVNLGAPVNSSSYEIQPYISSDGKSLFFASDRPDGFGDFDLYVSTRKLLHADGGHDKQK